MFKTPERGAGVFVSDSHEIDGAQRIGAFAAFAMAASPVFIAVPLLGALALGMGPPPIGDLEGEIASILAQPILYSTTGISLLVLGSALIVLALALYGRLRGASPRLVTIGTAAGVIGGTLAVLGGFGPAALATDVARIEGQDHQAAIAAYVATGIGSARLNLAGGVMFGAFVLIVSVAGARAGLLPRPLTYLGILLAILLAAGRLLPVWFATIAVIAIWSAWLGVVLLRSTSGVVPRQATSVGDARP
jgi:hypothetical protein